MGSRTSSAGSKSVLDDLDSYFRRLGRGIRLSRLQKPTLSSHNKPMERSLCELQEAFVSHIAEYDAIINLILADGKLDKAIKKKITLLRGTRGKSKV